jgi:acetylornithine deacetylase/succinyl-diaminopimelate desuccinylase-like protein
MTDLSVHELRSWYKKHEDRILEGYLSFLRIPSISTDPIHQEDVRKAAEWVGERLKKTGFKVDLWETKKYPVVFASHIVDPSYPTVLIYHHYDVQPVDPLEKWKSPPFEPVVKEGQVYARGASDNKGQCFYTLTALEAVFDLCRQVKLNIKLFIEGEEECGSVGAFQMVQEKREELKADYLLIVDMGFPSGGTPSITVGLRGIVALEVKCKNSNIDLHSGIMGGIALNPNRALIQLLAQLWDAKGVVAVPGFYEGVTSPTEEELSEMKQEMDLDYLREQFGLRAFQGEGDYSLWESNTIRPTLEINGISGGYAGAGFKTVIPSQAVAKISCRLVPNQNPTKIVQCLTEFLMNRVPKGLEIEITHDHGGRPVRTSPYTKLACICCDAYAEVLGRPCQKIICGASVPLVMDLAEAVGGEVAMVGVSLDSDDIHAPNEHFGLKQLQDGFLAMGCILRRLMEC